MGIEENLEAAAGNYQEICDILTQRGVSSTDIPGVLALAALMRANQGALDVGELAREIGEQLGTGRAPTTGERQVPYTVVECSFNSDGYDKDAGDLKTWVDYFKKQGWAPDAFYFDADERTPFEQFQEISGHDLQALSEREADESAICVYFTKGDQGLCLKYVASEDDPGFVVKLTTYHPDFEQGLHDIEALGQHDKWGLVKLVNELFEGVDSDSDGIDKASVSLVESGDRYRKIEHEEE